MEVVGLHQFVVALSEEVVDAFEELLEGETLVGGGGILDIPHVSLCGCGNDDVLDLAIDVLDLADDAAIDQLAYLGHVGDHVHVARVEVVGHVLRAERTGMIDEHGYDHRLQGGELQTLLEESESLLCIGQRLGVEVAASGLDKYCLQCSDEGVLTADNLCGCNVGGGLGGS